MRPTLPPTPLLAATVLLSACSSHDCPDDIVARSDDPLARRQWYAEGIPVDAAEGPTVVVAVIDNGFELTHPDLEGRWARNDDEPINGIDDDDNGYVDDLTGWDFLDGDADPSLSEAMSRLPFHATAAAGIIAAEVDNGEGIGGLCNACRILPLRARDFASTGNTLEAFPRALDYAIARGARVLSVSDGVPQRFIASTLLEEIDQAIVRAEAAGLLIVASAGNGGGTGDAEEVRWPAAHPLALSVAALAPSGGLAHFSTRGPDVDIAAPGQCVLSTYPGGAYDEFKGTSAAAPIVAALAARLLSRHPTWTPEHVRNRLLETVAPLPDTSDFGRVRDGDGP